MEFGKVGKHCDAELCNQQDFLPFECDFCKLIFCSTHYRVDDHKCSVGGDRDSVQVLICPICESRIKFTAANNEELQKQTEIW